MTWNTPLTPLAGAKATAAFWWAQVRDNFKAIGDPWTSYSPLWTVGTGTNPTNYTGTGSYIAAGKLIVFKARVAANPTLFTAGSGSYRISLPVPIVSAIGARFQVAVLDASTGNTFMGTTYSVSGSNVFVGYNDGSAILAGITNAAPVVFAANDYIEVTGIYESA